jgi:hypothetical protein
MFDGEKYVHNLDEIPKEPHFAIIKFGSIWIEGDERSRTNPGHGYPGHSQSTVEYIAFTDQSKWEKYIDGLIHPKYGQPEKNWMAVRVTPASVQTSTKVTVSLA